MQIILLKLGRLWVSCSGLAVNGTVEIIHCASLLVSTLIGRFDYITLRFCGLLLGFVGDCTIVLSAVVSMLVHP